MQLIFQDAEVYDVVLGRAIRTVPVDGEPPGVTLKREIYDECNLQAFSLIYRSLAGDNSGIVDASGATPNNGYALRTKLVRFNYQINDDSIPFLKQKFFNPLAFCQTREMLLDVWANEVRQATNILVCNGHPITEREKTLVFRQGLIREDLQTHLILPARVETFEQLVESARSYIQSSGSHPSSSVTSQRIFLTESERDGSYCSYCREVTGRKNRHRVDHCRRKAATGEFANGDTHAAKRPRIAGTAGDKQHITCFKCHQQGHYAPQCPNPPAPRSGRGNVGDRAGRGGHFSSGRGGRGGSGGAYYLWVPQSDVVSSGSSVSHSVPPSHPPSEFVSAEAYPFFSDVLHECYLVS